MHRLNSKTTLSFTNSSYYPTSYADIRNGVLHFRCTGLVPQRVPAGNEFQLNTSSQFPARYRPAIDSIYYVLGTSNTSQYFRVAFYSDGRITMATNVELPASTGINVHVTTILN